MNRDDEVAQLRQLERGLRFPPIFRAEPDEKPVMYSYVRSRAERPEFVALLDVLMLSDSYGVVLVGPTHLSNERAVAGLLAQAIRFTGAKLCFLSGEAPLTHGASSRDGVPVGRWLP